MILVPLFDFTVLMRICGRRHMSFKSSATSRARPGRCAGATNLQENGPESWRPWWFR